MAYARFAFLLRRVIPLGLAGLAVACVTSDPLGSGGGEGSDGPTGSGGEGGGGALLTCGDAVCDEDENCDNCAQDCPCGPVCGDGACDAPDEACDTCLVDCGSCATCGDSVCDPTEGCATCFEDCGVCACMPDGLEPNNGSGTATPITSGAEYCDLSVCAGDYDWLSFAVTSGFTANVTFLEGQGDLDLEIYSGQTFDYVDGAYAHADDETLTLSGLSPGTYFARVYGYMGAENPVYCIQVDTN